MIKNVWAVLPLLLSSCGIISIEYLPPPPVSPAFDAQTDFNKLVFTHVASTYSSNPDFQGYEVYYKIYPLATDLNLTVSGNLAADNSQLVGNTPTRDYLITMGYQRLTTSDQNSGNVPIVLNPTGGATITLDFTTFLSNMNVHAPPLNHNGTPAPERPTLQVGAGSPFFVYRSVSSTTSVFSYPWFSDLYDTFTLATSDMLRTGTNAITGSTLQYEIDVFLVAYSFTPEQTIYSQPVPWGVISVLKMAL